MCVSDLYWDPGRIEIKIEWFLQKIAPSEFSNSRQPAQKCSESRQASEDEKNLSIQSDLKLHVRVWSVLRPWKNRNLNRMISAKDCPVGVFNIKITRTEVQRVTSGFRGWRGFIHCPVGVYKFKTTRTKVQRVTPGFRGWGGFIHSKWSQAPCAYLICTETLEESKFK